MLKKIDSLLRKITEYTGVILLIAMFAITIFGILNRYVLVNPVFWTAELTRYLMFYMVTLSCGLVFRENRHPNLLIVLEKMPSKIRKNWLFIVDILIFFSYIVVIKEGFSMAVDALIMKTPALRIPFFYIYLALPIGGVLMEIQIIFKYIVKNKGG
ncbi:MULTISPECIES: TRAP transporter small permease [Pseudothermotoga]|jgi:TRAP-type C4-dicarboxylate transport system permease small subunit|uniref:TRAP transporter small permease n=1 Tax=Pseudothermotoga TaxID=1643951 RepID=UPI0004246709|nr:MULTISPECIES: TRAP transporter small permease [Pseudothermotoga]MDK2885148.1 TRAP-type transport system small permease protein [Pseudothermotoga sp.]